MVGGPDREGLDRGERFVALLRPAVRQAAAVARALEGRVANRPKHGESTEVKAALTIADSAAQEAILVVLRDHFPEVALEAEEDTPTVGQFPADAPEVVVLDPIDGTLNGYLEARGPYAVMLGLAEDDRFHAAHVALPREGMFLDGLRDHVPSRTRPRGEPRPIRASADGARVLVSYTLPEEVTDRLRAAGYEVAMACGGAISVAPLLPGVCAGLRLAPAGSRISERGRIGLVLSRGGGAVALCESGAPFPDDIRAPARVLTVAAEPGDAEALLRAVEPAL